jgi:hypothetical protein
MYIYRSRPRTLTPSRPAVVPLPPVTCPTATAWGELVRALGFEPSPGLLRPPDPLAACGVKTRRVLALLLAPKAPRSGSRSGSWAGVVCMVEAEVGGRRADGAAIDVIVGM